MKDRRMTVTEASRNFADLINRSFYRGESTVLTKSGEAVAMVVPIGETGVTGRDWLERWKQNPRLGPDDAEAFENDLNAARDSLPELKSAWD